MNKKILILILLIFIPIIGIKVKAETLNRTFYDDIYFVQNGLPDYYMSDKQFHLSFDGINAYCLDPHLKITGYDYNIMDLNNYEMDGDTRNYLKKVIYYGYDYPGHENVRYYMATQALIWEKVSTDTIQFFTKQYGYGEYIDVSYEKNEIMNLVNNHEKMPWFSNMEFIYSHKEKLSLNDNLLKDYEIIESNYIDTYISDNILYIDNLKNFIGDINIKFKHKNYQNKSSKIYYRTGSQTMITGGYLDDKIFTLKLHITGGSVTINKLDSDSGKNIINSEVIVNIRNTDTNDYIYIDGSKDLKINSEGFFRVDNVPFGYYEIKEVSTNEFYNLNENSIYFEVNGNVNVNLYNDKKKESIKATKYGEEYNYENNNYENDFLPNIHFKLYALEDIVTKDNVLHYKKDELVKEGITDNNGNIIFDDLLIGKYYIKEEVPNNYVDDDNIYIVDLKENINSNITIYNKLKKGSLVINKLDSDSKEKIINSEVIINVRNIDNNEYLNINGSKDLKINNDGVLEIENIPLGNYEIKEISTNDEYLLNDEIINIELKNNMEVNLYNEKKKGKIIITKYGEKYNYIEKNYDEELLSNVKFSLYDDDSIIKEGKTNSDGQIVFEDLLLKKYYLKEEVPSLYIDNNDILEINLKEEEIIDVHNILKKKDLIIKKIDSITEEPLSNVIFEIFYGNNSLGQYETNVDGQIILNDMPYGKYKIKEIKTKDNYVLDEEVKEVELGIENEFLFTNDKKIIIPNALSNKTFSLNIIWVFILLWLKYLKYV